MLDSAAAPYARVRLYARPIGSLNVTCAPCGHASIRSHDAGSHAHSGPPPVHPIQPDSPHVTHSAAVASRAISSLISCTSSELDDDEVCWVKIFFLCTARPFASLFDLTSPLSNPLPLRRRPWAAIHQAAMSGLSTDRLVLVRVSCLRHIFVATPLSRLLGSAML